jgi:hypothetical protein
LWFEASPDKKFMRPPISTNKSWVWWSTPVILAAQEAQIGECMSSWPGINAKPYLKNNESKKG